MRLPRMSLAGSILGIVLVAFGLAILREDLKIGEVWKHGHFLVIGVLPMACLLTWAMLIGLIGLIRRGVLSPFLVGFELAGWGMLFLIVLLDAASDDSDWGPIRLAKPLLHGLFPRDVINYYDYEILLTHFLLFLTPPLIVSLIGGWLVSRSGLRVDWRERREFKPEKQA
jgi:hypothetical protein